MSNFREKLRVTGEKLFASFSSLGLREIKLSQQQVVDDFSEKAHLKEGDTIPDFALVNYDGVLIRLQDYLQKGPVVLSFYRGMWCPFCVLEIQILQEYFAEIQALGAQVIAVTPESPDYTILAKARSRIQFPILTDESCEVIQQFGLETKLSREATKVLETELGLDLAVHNFGDNRTLPVPATYIVGQDREVKFAFVNPDYTQRLDPADITGILKKLTFQTEISN